MIWMTYCTLLGLLYAHSLGTFNTQNQITSNSTQRLCLPENKTLRMVHCAVPRCLNSTSKNKNLSFFRIPNTKGEKAQWIRNIKRDPGPRFNLATARVCSNHFKKEDITKTLTGKGRLRPGAFPTVFTWNKASSRRPPKQRFNNSVEEKSTEIPQQSPENTIEHPTCTEEPIQVDSPDGSDHDYVTSKQSTDDQLLAAQAHIAEIEEKIAKLQISNFGVARFVANDSQIKLFTGFPSYKLLEGFYRACQPTAVTMVRWAQYLRHQRGETTTMRLTEKHNENVILFDQFFLFLHKMRLGNIDEELADKFHISPSTVSRIIITWSNYLYFILGSLPIWPRRRKVDETMPEVFKTTFPKTRVILDCTEVKTQRPSSLYLNSELYSHYKNSVTFKGLIGITPTGAVSFVSSLYPGSISDKEITKQSNIVRLLEPGDQVMVDKGFLIEDLLKERGASLVIPPFLYMKSQFEKEEVAATQVIARLRIHVERAIRRIKEYQIFSGVVPLALAGSINQMWTVCSLLTNFQGPLF